MTRLGTLLCAVVFALAIPARSGPSLAAQSGPPPRERLIGQFKGGASPHWCGNDALVVEGRAFDIGNHLEWVDLRRSRRLKIGSNRNWHFMSCSFDGAWVVYADWDDRARQVPSELPGLPEDSWSQGWVSGLWRFEVATGRRQRIAVIRQVLAYENMAPSTLKVFLGRRHPAAIRMPPPRWEAVWMPREWERMGVPEPAILWSKDSSSLVYGQADGVGIAKLDPQGWVRFFKHRLDSLAVAIDVDRAGRIYMAAGPKGGPGRIYRCHIVTVTPPEVGCELIYSQPLRVITLDVLPDGDALFSEEGGGGACIRRATPGKMDAPCFINKAGYEAVSLAVDLSPDGRGIAFYRPVAGIRPGGIGDTVRTDVFVLENLLR